MPVPTAESIGRLPPPDWTWTTVAADRIVLGRPDAGIEARAERSDARQTTPEGDPIYGWRLECRRPVGEVVQRTFLGTTPTRDATVEALVVCARTINRALRDSGGRPFGIQAVLDELQRADGRAPRGGR